MNKAEDYSHKLQNVSAEKIVKLLNEYFVKENSAVKSKDNKESILCKNLIDDFKIGIHFRQVISHKKFINRVWEKLRQHFPNVTHDQILQHDASKIASLTEILGYTGTHISSIFVVSNFHIIILKRQVGMESRKPTLGRRKSSSF